MATGQDPGSLGVYGFRNRVDHSYDGLGIVSSRSIQRAGDLGPDRPRGEDGRSSSASRRTIPPRKVNGVSVGCFLTPDTDTTFTPIPPAFGDEIAPARRRTIRSTSRASAPTTRLASATTSDAMTRKHFAVVRHYLQRDDWDYFHFVEIGLDRLQHGFWQSPRPRARTARARQPLSAT